MSRNRAGQHEFGIATVTLDASGAGTLAVEFAEAFLSTPTVSVQQSRSDDETRAAAIVTTGGFSLAIAGSTVTSGDIEVFWVAMERR